MRVPRFPELEEAIVEDPQDLPRISVWADALVAAGSPLGEWVALALRDPDGADPALRRRAEALLAAHGAWWYGPLATQAAWQRGAVSRRGAPLPTEARLVWPPAVVAPLGTATLRWGLLDAATGTARFARGLTERPTGFALTRLQLLGPVLPADPLRGLPASLRALHLGDPATKLGVVTGALPPRLDALTLEGAFTLGALTGPLTRLSLRAAGPADLDGLVRSALPALAEVALRGPITARGLVEAELPALRRVTLEGLAPAEAAYVRDALGARGIAVS